MPHSLSGMTTRRRRTSRAVGTLAVVLGDQLDPAYLHVLGLDPGRDVVAMMEVPSASTDPPSHVQRSVLFLSAMRHHADALRQAGWRVAYRSLVSDDGLRDFQQTLGGLIADLEPREVACIEPGSHGVRAQIERACAASDTTLRVAPDPHFLCTTDAFADWATGRRELILEYFYRQQRRTLGLLLTEDGKPVGGSWNYDKDNRKRFRDPPDPPPVARFDPDAVTRQVIADVRRVLPDLPGRVDRFSWPVTRAQALTALDDFIENRLALFGDYQDAMWAGHHTLYHALLSASLNLKLLDPREVCAAAIAAYDAGRAPLNAVEGFVRQIIGWREFVRGVYWHAGEGYARLNELDQHGALPEFYWSGNTDMNCMRHALDSVLDLAYGHHIARLMVTGNFALIAGVHPSRVNDWYLGMYADAVEWVTTPNTVGMAMHADGGVVGTKPYAASGKYIQRMSNYCAACRYDVRKRTGDDACPFNTLYWDFLIRNEARFRDNRRMAMSLRNTARLGSAERVEISISARATRDRFGVGPVGAGA